MPRPGTAYPPVDIIILGSLVLNIIYFIVPVLVARAYGLVATSGFSVLPEHLPLVARGVLSDIAIGVAAGLLFLPLIKRTALYYSIWTLWVLLYSFNIDHIRVNMSNMDASFIGLALQREFLLGSVLSLRTAMHFAVCMAFSLPFLLLARKTSPIKNWTLVAAVAVLMALIVFLPASRALPNWLQMNLVEENARNFLRGTSLYANYQEIDDAVRSSFFGKDLSGEPVVAYPGKKQNVILLIVEGIGRETSMSGLMPNFRALSEENLSYKNFISLQRQTNRGLYAIVCGDYPNYLGREAKSDIVGIHGVLRPCLPEVFRRSGYHTVFMQSAPLGYMRKDLFAEKAGFDEIVGGYQFDAYFAAGDWGVDDATLYNYAIPKIKHLNNSDKPWLLTLLTSSTHHPYIIPGRMNPSPEQAIKYADDSLGMFMRALVQEGMLKNTLLIITSDETTFSHAPAGVQRELGTIHGSLVVIAPQINSPMVHDGLFTQADLQLSIADYLNIEPGESTGRSVFRKYAAGRNLIAGNVYSRKIFGFADDDKLYVCDGLLNCSAYDFGEGGPFGTSIRNVDADEEYISALRQTLLYNELNTGKLRTSIVFREREKKYSGNSLLLGDHKVSAKKGDTLIWNVNIAPEDIVHVVIAVNYGSDLKHFIHKTEKISPENPLNFHYTHNVPEDVEEVWTKVSVIAPPEVGYTVKDLTIERRKSLQ
jgi:phosphoglycerol transferase MdoB-like AlkP superfamily enzyme